MADERTDFDCDPTVYRTLLESTKAIPWKIDWASMSFAYIGPQIEALLGWSQDSWLTANDWATRIHPEDRERVVNFCISQSKAGIDHEADYRALTKDNGYVWIRDVVHVLRDEKGEVVSLVGFMFDISERKKSEQRLLALQKELEALSFQDGLTGVANRRRFETTLEIEWASARRSQSPLAAIILDVDYFKQYNDRYGHVQGDECLKSLARALSLAIKRPRDMIARIGGEEFVLLLPETGLDAALQLAERCKDAVAALEIPHDSSSVGEFVTTSMGVGAVQPSGGMEPMRFIEAVDKLLYKAKQAGRNRIEPADLELDSDATSGAFRKAGTVPSNARVSSSPMSSGG
jgi:diguanylate cyclase (GGDEF)-like protein/PAS domain S-box-containing protein